jgi:hypothetical protein
MNFNYYLANVPSYLDTNVMDCPFAYCLRKYELEDPHLLPKPHRNGNCEYIVCLPTHRANSWMSAFTEGENMTFDYMRTDNYDIDNCKNMYVMETRNVVTPIYILVQAVPTTV